MSLSSTYCRGVAIGVGIAPALGVTFVDAAVPGTYGKSVSIINDFPIEFYLECPPKDLSRDCRLKVLSLLNIGIGTSSGIISSSDCNDSFTGDSISSSESS